MSFRSSSRESLGLMLGFVGMAIFGGTLPATRMAVSQIDPIALTSLRTAIAGLCSLALLMVLRRPLPPRALWPQLAIAMLCVGILFPLLMSLGMQTVDASHGGVVLGILPIATALVAVAITHERPRPLFWIASFAGAALVIAFALRQGGGTLSAGDLLLFAAVAVSSIGYAFSGRLTAEMPGWEVISWVLVIALPISLPAAALTMPADLAHIALKPWLGLLYVALFSQWIGFFAWNAGMAMGGIARVSQVQLLQPFITFALAATLQRRDDHAADRAVRRSRGRDGGDLHADARAQAPPRLRRGSLRNDAVRNDLPSGEHQAPSMHERREPLPELAAQQPQAQAGLQRGRGDRQIPDMLDPKARPRREPDRPARNR